MFDTNEDGSLQINMEYVRALLEGVVKDAAAHPDDAAEGLRLSEQYRKSFPDMSDHDMGSIVMIFVQVFIALLESQASASAIERYAMIYAHTGADLLRTSLEFDEM